MTFLQKRGPGAAISGTIIFYLLFRSKAIPYLPATAVEILRILAVFRREIRKAFSAPGNVQVGVHGWFWIFIPQQGIDTGNLRELLRIMLFQVSKEEVCVTWTEAAGRGAGFQSPSLQNVFVAIRPCEVHFHQREMIDEQGIFVLSAPPALFHTEPHVHFMGFPILWTKTLKLFVFQEFPANEF